MDSSSTDCLVTSSSRSKISRSNEPGPRPTDPCPRHKDPCPRHKICLPKSTEKLERDRSEVHLPTDRISSSTSNKTGSGGLEQRLKKEMERTAHLRETIRKAKERIARLEYVKRSDRKLNKAFARSANSVCEGISLKPFSPLEREKRRKKHRVESQRMICGTEEDTMTDDSPNRQPRQMEALELSVERLSAKTRELQKAVETASLATVLLRSSSASEMASVWEEKLSSANQRVDVLEVKMHDTSDRFTVLEEHIRSGDERASKEQQGVRRAHQKLLDRLGRLESAAERLADSNVEQTHRLKSLEEAIKAAEQRRADEVSQQETKMSIDAPQLSEMTERLNILEQRVKSYHSCSNEKFQDLRNALRMTRENDSSMDAKKKEQLTKLEDAAAAINEKLAHLEHSTLQEREAMSALERSAKNAFSRTSTLERAVVIMQEAVLDKFLPLLEKLLPLQEMQLKDMAEHLDFQGAAYLPRQKYLLESIAPLVVEAQQAIQKATSSTEEIVKRRIAHLEDTTNSLEQFLDQADEEQRWREMKCLSMDEQFGAMDDTVNHLTRRLIHEQHAEPAGVKIRQITSSNGLELPEKMEDSLESLFRLEDQMKTSERLSNLGDFRNKVSDNLSKSEKGKTMKIEKIYQRARQMTPKDKLLDDYIHDMYDISESLSPGDEISSGIEMDPEGNTESHSQQVPLRTNDLTFEQTLERLEEEETAALMASRKKIKASEEMTNIKCLHLPESMSGIGRQDQVDMDLSHLLGEKGQFDLDDI